MSNRQDQIRTHQDLQTLQGEVNEVFQIALQRGYTAEKTIDVIKAKFDAREEEEMDKEFWEKY
jgi:hypothetical protein